MGMVRFRHSAGGWLLPLVLCFLLFFPITTQADELGEFILNRIRLNPNDTYSEAALLLMTRDLGWYEKNMGKLPQEVQNRVQQLRIRTVGESCRSAAVAMGESTDKFLASGSCKPGRDIDLLYIGKDKVRARQCIDAAIEKTTERILAEGADDALLKLARDQKIAVPTSLTSSALDVVASDLPNFGYKDIRDALAQARAVQQSGGTNALEVLQAKLQEALEQNLLAQVDSQAKDMYRGAVGQRFFALNYLGDPDKVRYMVRDASGTWALKPGGRAALTQQLLEQVDAIMPSSKRAKFAQVACDFSMFFKHEEGGVGGTAKYVNRIWETVDNEALFVHMSKAESEAIVLAQEIAQNPTNASELLAKAGLNEATLRSRVQGGLYQAVENQLVLNTENLLIELERLDEARVARGAKALDELDVLAQKQLLKFDLNDMANGLAAIADVPGPEAQKLLSTLKQNFGKHPLGPSVLAYMERQLNLMTGESANIISRRLLNALVHSDDISPADATEINRRIQAGLELPDNPAVRKLKQARQEVLFLSSVDMLEMDANPKTIDQVVDDWRRQRSNAVIRSVSDEVRETVTELKKLPPTELKTLGWLEVEIELPMQTRARLKLLPDQMADVAERMQRRLSKQAISLAEWQRKTRQCIMNSTPTELGEPGDLGAMDVVFSAANGMYQTYSILNSDKPMTEEQENLALANAWVTSLPIVGDFADGIIAGIEAGFTGNKRKALEAGLFVTIGVMGVVPGGQIPAMITGLIMAGTPIAEGIYEASQAQDLIQTWVASGNWEGGGDKPMVLVGLFDRTHMYHELTYKDLLTSKGDVPYESEKADGLFTVPTINGSIREYAEKYVFPQYPQIKEKREALKVLFPNFSDKYWTDEYSAKYHVEKEGGKAALFIFREYHQIRTQALERTIAQLKQWAEDEFRVAHDYEGEVEAIKEKLRQLQTELRVTTLVAHADATALAYSKVIKNTMEQETLSLSRYRIYKHYLDEYNQVAISVRKIKKHLAELPADSYQPTNWHLTGYPEFDKPRLAKLSGIMETGRAATIVKIEELIRDLGFYSKGGYDPQDPVQKEALQVLLALRYKICFIENLIDYYETLANQESAWSDAYNTALARYTEVRNQYADLPAGMQDDVTQKALGDAVITFVAAMPYALASGERDLYRDTARQFRIKLNSAMDDFEFACFQTGKAGKILEEGFLRALKIEMTLSPVVPKIGETIRAKAVLTAQTKPTTYYWIWEAEDGLDMESRLGSEIEVKVTEPGNLTVQIIDRLEGKAKVLAKSTMKVATSKEKLDDPNVPEPNEPNEPAPEPKGTLKVTLKAPEKVVTVGDTVTVTASVGGGTAPYDYTWSGAGGSGASTSFTPAHAGDTVISLEVTDAEGEFGEALATVRVAPAKIKITGAEGDVVYGSEAFIKAEGLNLLDPIATADTASAPGEESPFNVDTSSDATISADYWEEHQKMVERVEAEIAGEVYIPSAGDDEIEYESEYVPPVDSEDDMDDGIEYRYVWQSSPGLTFDPPEGAWDSTTVTYDRLGEVLIWCEQLKWIDGAYQTVGESEQVTVNVIAPDFSVSYAPANGKAYVGQQVTATIHARPAVGDKVIDYRWLDPSTSNRLELDSNGARIAFTVRDTNPVKLKALARVPVHGDELGEIESSYTGVAFGLNAWMVQPPTLPRTWDPQAKELKTIERGSRGTDERITLKAELQGGTPPEGVRYKWTVNDGTTLSNDISQTPTVSRSQAGSIVAHVTASDSKGHKLADAQVTVEVVQIVSTPADTKDTDSKDKKQVAQQNISDAREHMARGDMPAAEKAVRQAEKQDPQAAAPVIKQVAQAAQKSGWRAVSQRDFNQAIENLEVAQRLDSKNKDTQEKLQKAQRFAKTWAQVEAKVPAFNQLVAAQKPFSAQKAMLEIQHMQHEMPGSMNNPVCRQIMDDFNRCFQEYNAFILQWERLHTQYFKDKNWQAMLDNALEAQQRELSPSRQKDIQAAIDFARQQLAQQAESQEESDEAKKKSELRSPAKPAPHNPPISAAKQDNSFKLPQTIFAPGENISLDFTVPGGLPNNAWVGIVPTGISHGSAQLNEQRNIGRQGLASRTSGQMVFKAPKEVGQYDIRISNPQNNQELLSVTFSVAVPEHAVSLELTKKTFAPNEKIEVAFTASPFLPNNSWIGLIPAGVSHGSTKLNDQHDIAYQGISGQTSGTKIFTAPREIGPYSFRLNETSNDKEITSIDFKVAVPMEGNTFKLPKTTFAPNEKISLEFTASKHFPNNTWIGMVPAGISHGSTKLNDQYDIAYQGISGQASGTKIFTAPREVGQYSFRMNETTNDKEVATINFNVAVPVEGNGFKLPKTTFAPYEKIILDFTANEHLPNNTWVGLIPAGISHGSTKLNDQHDIAYQSVSSRTAAQMVFAAPKDVGQYSFRMNETTNDKEVATINFNVAVPSEGNTFNLPKTTFTTGEKITLDFTANEHLPNNTWVGLVPAGVSHGSTKLNDQHDVAYQSVSGRSSGQMTFTAPSKPGKYSFRMNETSNDKEVASIEFAVVEKKN